MPPVRSDKRSVKARTMAGQKAYYEMRLAEQAEAFERRHRQDVAYIILLLDTLAEMYAKVPKL